MTKVRSFTAHDYMGYAGAERYPTGHAPIYSQRGFDDVYGGGVIDLVADAVGITAYAFTGDADKPATTWYMLEGAPLKRAAARALLEGMANYLTPSAMAEYGFTAMGKC